MQNKCFSYTDTRKPMVIMFCFNLMSFFVEHSRETEAKLNMYTVDRILRKIIQL